MRLEIVLRHSTSRAHGKCHIYSVILFGSTSLSTMHSERYSIYKLLSIVLILLLVMGSSSATLDLSNFNVDDFQFFRYQQKLPNGELRQVPPPPPSIGGHIQKAKAVGTFVQRLLFGYIGEDNRPIPLSFPPTVDHLRQRFEQKYGYRGKYLVEQLGNGYFRYSSGFTPCYSCRY